MAQKRMFDKRVIDTDKFGDLPHSTKALYFMAGMFADDKGFFQPKSLQRQFGFNDDDYKILIAKGFFIVFESGIMVITDWNKNNWLDSRRVTETEYINELKLLESINDKYCLKDYAKQMLSENSIEENSIEEINSNSIYDFVQENFGRTLSSVEYEEISKWEDTDLTRYAIKQAILNGAYNIKYINSILSSYKKKKIETVQQAQEEEKRFKASKDKPYKQVETKVPDWYEKNIEEETLSADEEAKMKAMLSEFK